MGITYKESGVDIDTQNSFIDEIKPIIKSTFGPEVIGGIGGFAGLFKFNSAVYKDPILLASTDGVGTKLKIAIMANHHEGVGIDLVAMVVNDIIVQGAQPLFFLDYFATGKLKPKRDKTIIASIASGCKEAGCSLIGGETAEMPGFYGQDEYDLAGFGVGVVEGEALINGSRITKDDVIIGLKSSGIHSNGFSLVRKVFFDIAGLKVDSYVDELGKTLAQELLTPTRIYVKSILNLAKGFTIKGIVHVTGGGFIDNIPRILPENTCAVIDRESWVVPPVFRLMQKIANVDETEMFRTFNMGIGLILVVSPKDVDDVFIRLKGLGEPGIIIGRIEQRTSDKPPVILR